ncbi:MAG: DMT family protein [Lentisphaeria bacterium]|nr:DMT family protein [Lentisphaeria bacterium]
MKTQYVVLSVAMLSVANIFMTFAWYAHLKNLQHKAWYIAAIVSWGIAFCEYMIQVPANRIGYNAAGLTAGQLKIIQEIVTLSVFIPFSFFYLKESLSWNYLYAAICMAGAVYFVMRG